MSPMDYAIAFFVCVVIFVSVLAINAVSVAGMPVSVGMFH